MDGSSASRSRSVSFSDLLRAGPTETGFPLSSRMLRMGLSPSVTMCRYCAGSKVSSRSPSCEAVPFNAA